MSRNTGVSITATASASLLARTVRGSADGGWTTTAGTQEDGAL